MNNNQKITMKSRECTPEILYDLYWNKNITLREIKNIFGIKDRKVLDRWFRESNIDKKEDGGTYTFDRYYFDIIDSEEKAYWIGFIWCDGYVLKRQRKNKNISYEFKLTLAERDRGHLIKLNECLKSNYKIKRYKSGGFDGKYPDYHECRLYICNKYFAGNLFNNYGLIPHRYKINKLISKIPPQYYKHFIRGILDADGSVISYYTNDKYCNKPSYKNSVKFDTYSELLTFIQEHFYNKSLIFNKTHFRKRHKDRDGHCENLGYSGTIQTPRILNYLYKDATVYLDRKYNKYLEIINHNKEEVNEVD